MHPNTERKTERWLDIAIVISLFLVTLIPFIKVLLIPNQVAYGIRELTADFSLFYAAAAVIREAYAEHIWPPLWNPYYAPGRPMQMFQYPILSLIRFLPISLGAAFNWEAILHMWWAGLGMFVLLRDLGARRVAATFSAISITFCGIIIPRFLAGQPYTIYTVAWAVWIFVFYRRLLEKPSWGHLILTVAAVVFEKFTSLHPQYIIIVYSIPIGYFFFYASQQLRAGNWRRVGSALAMSVLVTFLAIGLTAINILPVFEFSQRVQRIAGEMPLDQAMAVSLSLPDLATMFVPLLWVGVPTSQTLGFAAYWEIHPYAGLLALGLATLAPFARDGEIRRPARYFAIIGLIGLGLAINDSPLFYLLHKIVPILGNSGRFSFIWVFSIAVLGGLGLETLIRALTEPGEHLVSVHLRRLGIILTGVSAVTASAALVWQIWGMQLTAALQSAGYFYWLETHTFAAAQHRNLYFLLITIVLATVLVWVAALKLVPVRRWAWLVVGGLLIEMYLFAWPMIVPQSISELYNPDNPMKVLNLDPAEIRLENAGRVGPIYQASSLGMNDPVDLSTLWAIRRLGMNGGRGSQLLAGGYFVTTEPVSEPGVEELQHVGNAYLYGYTNRWPRIYAAPRVHVVEEEAEALVFVADDAFNPFEVAVVIAPDEEVPNLPAPPPSETAEVTAEFIEYGLNSFRARVVTDRPVMVVFSETYYPGWEAWVDGEPATIWQANYAFRGVVIDPGAHFIDMEYRPGSFRLGLSISAGTLALMTVVTGVMLIRQRLVRR